MGDGTYSANATSANGALVIGAVIGVAGKTLTLDGTSTATNTVSSIRTVLSVVKNGTGYWQLNGSVNDFNGLTLNDGTLASGGDGKLGTNTVTINGGTLTSISSAARIWTNAFVVNNNFTLGQATGGTGALTLSGAMNLGGGVRTIAMSNVTASGDFFLGIISNGGINKTGLCTMVLSNANTYAGGTIVSAGTLTGAANAAFGTGDITVAGGAKLTLTNSVSSNFINDTAKLILGTNSTLNLVFTGTDTIGGLSLDGGSTWLAGGTYNVAALTAAGGLGTYTGGGSLTVPASNRTLGLYIIQ
jgi:autotransporter-associated beta strand protein